MNSLSFTTQPNQAVQSVSTGDLQHHKRNLLHSIQFCCVLWLRILLKALSICLPVILLLLFYFLPAIIWDLSRKDLFRVILYEKLYWVFGFFFYFGFLTIYSLLLFGYYFCERPLLFVWLPGMLLFIFWWIFLPFVFIAPVISLVVINLSILLVRHQQLPQAPSQLLLDQFQRKVDMAWPLAKMATVIVFVFITLTYLLSVFLNSTFYVQLSLRFLVLPLLLALTSGIQLQILRTLSVKHIEYAIPLLWISNGYVKVIERLFANSIFQSGDYGSFVLSTFAASIIEIFNHSTYFIRIHMSQRITSFVSNVYARRKRSVRSLSFANTLQPHRNSNRDQGLNNFDWMLGIRKRMIVEDLSIELIMVFTVTFILFFSSSLVDDERFETIPNIQTCIVQLSIQLVFEMVSDVFGLWWCIKRHGIPLSADDIQLWGRWSWLWLFFMFFQTFGILYFLLFL